MALRPALGALGLLALWACALPLAAQVPLRGADPGPLRPSAPPPDGLSPLRPATPHRMDATFGPQSRCLGGLDFGTLLIASTVGAPGPVRVLVAIDPHPGGGVRASVPSVGGAPARCWVEGVGEESQLVPLVAELRHMEGGASIPLELSVSRPEATPEGAYFWVGGILELPLALGGLSGGRYEGRVVLVVTE